MSAQTVRVEGHYLKMPEDGYVLPKLGERWVLHYGDKPKDCHHFHNLFELGYCYRGDGQLVISDQEYRYTGCCFTAIPAEVPHTTESAPGHLCKWEFLFVDMDHFVGQEMRDFGIPADEILGEVNQRGRMQTVLRHERMGRLITAAMDECRRAEPFYRESLKGYLKMLVIELLRLGSADSEILSGGSRNRLLIEQAVEYIRQHFREELRVEDLARVSNLSETHFRRLFEERTKMRPLEYVNKMRVEEACRLLLEKDLPAAEAGYLAGFRTAYSFNRNFREATGSTPLQWKKRMQEEG